MWLKRNIGIYVSAVLHLGRKGCQHSLTAGSLPWRHVPGICIRREHLTGFRFQITKWLLVQDIWDYYVYTPCPITSWKTLRQWLLTLKGILDSEPGWKKLHDPWRSWRKENHTFPKNQMFVTVKRLRSTPWLPEAGASSDVCANRWQ